MDALQTAWGVSFVAAGWLLVVGAIRMIAYRSGEVDHTPGMRGVALFTLAGGAVAAVVFVVLTIVIVT